MTGAERGFLLLTSHLGNPQRKPLTPAQMRTLSQRVSQLDAPGEDRALCQADLLRLGYSRDMAARILALLSEEALLDHYLRQGKKQDCQPIPQNSPRYPQLIRQRLHREAPGCLWAKGDVGLLDTIAVSLVGSRDLREENRAFAAAVGAYAARQGFTLVSGNARGADRTAQEACLAAGGQVISIVADALNRCPLRRGVLYLSEEDYDAPFSAQRALSRNRCIHTLGRITFVAQSDHGRGGTWQGCSQNLRHGWTPVICLQDGSEAVRALEDLGAYAIQAEDLKEYQVITKETFSLFGP